MTTTRDNARGKLVTRIRVAERTRQKAIREAEKLMEKADQDALDEVTAAWRTYDKEMPGTFTMCSWGSLKTGDRALYAGSLVSIVGMPFEDAGLRPDLVRVPMNAHGGTEIEQSPPMERDQLTAILAGPA